MTNKASGAFAGRFFRVPLASGAAIFGGIEHDEALASMRRFIDEVAPHLPR